MNPAARAAALFRARYGVAPAAVASAPGRVNLIGEHVDYYGGLVLPVALGERTAVAAGPAPGRLRAVAEDVRFTPVDVPWAPVRAGTWSDYAAGVAVLMAAERSGPDELGVALAVASDVPVGAGVSSSAALEVATAAALDAWWQRRHTPDALARIAHAAETTFVGVPCGMMDQMAAAVTSAHCALLLDCRTLERESVPVTVDLVLADTGERHDLRDGAYARRRAEGEAALARIRADHPSLDALVDIPPARLSALLPVLTPEQGRRVRHVVNEQQRTRLAARALESGDAEAFSALVNASHASLRDLYECSSPRLDAVAEAARQLPRVLGARMVGAGWGGSVLVVCEPGAAGVVAAQLSGDTALALPAVRVVVPGEGVRVE